MPSEFDDDPRGKRCQWCNRWSSTYEKYIYHMERCARKQIDKYRASQSSQSASSTNDDKGVVVPAGTALICEQQALLNDIEFRKRVSKYMRSLYKRAIRASIIKTFERNGSSCGAKI